MQLPPSSPSTAGELDMHTLSHADTEKKRKKDGGDAAYAGEFTRHANAHCANTRHPSTWRDAQTRDARSPGSADEARTPPSGVLRKKENYIYIYIYMYTHIHMYIYIYIERERYNIYIYIYGAEGSLNCFSASSLTRAAASTWRARGRIARPR